MKKVCEYFGKQNLLVYTYEDLKKSPKEVINQIANFIGTTYEGSINLNEITNKGIGHWRAKLLRYINKANKGG